MSGNARSAPNFEVLAQPGVRSLRAYDPGHDLVALRRRFAAAALVELGSNENAFGPSPRVREALLAALPLVHRYPDPQGGELKQALGQRLAVAPDELVLGNGSHELLVMLAQVFAGPGTDVLMSRFGFAVYALAAQAVGASLRVIDALARGASMPLGHDLAAIGAAADERTRLIYLANPNNPTGTWFTRAALERLLECVPAECLVVVDEAYAEYVDGAEPQSALSLRSRFPNLVVTRTFSKAYALAGLRVGYAVGHPGVVALLERLRESFNVNALGLAAAEAALGDDGHLHSVRSENSALRRSLGDALSIRGYRVFPSQTNFLLVEVGEGAAALETALLARGVVPRPMAGYGLPDCLRITVASQVENARLLEALEQCA